MTSVESYAKKLGASAREASRQIRSINHASRVQMLKKLAVNLKFAKKIILTANKKDLQISKNSGLSEAMIDRLTLNDKRLDGIIKSVKEIASLKDPLGVKLSSYVRKDKLKINKVSVPIGSIFFIFESRPNVTIDGAALCLKSGNAVVLRGGKESRNSNEAFAGVVRSTLKQMKFPENTVQLVDRGDKSLVNILLQDTENFDLVIPRGGEKLIEAVVEHAKIPVIKHYKGLCHIYIDKSAKLDRAGPIVINAKVQPGAIPFSVETGLVTFMAGCSRTLLIHME